jgi:DNA mismatch repair protein MutS2
MIEGSAAPSRVNVNVDLQPRQGLLSELNVIGSTVDESMMTDLRELRIVHGHGTGQLRRAVADFLKNYPLIERYETAPQNQGGGGATIAYLKD